MIVTKRVWRNLEARRVLWLDVERGTGVIDGRTVCVGEAAPLVDVLELAARLGVDLVNITGGRPGGDAGAADGFLAWSDACGDWEPAGHFLSRLTMPILRFARGDTRVELQRAAAWFGVGDYAPAHCAAALELVAELVADRFGDGAMRVRPAATGLELFLRTVPAEGWPVLDDELAELVRSTSGQGRIECPPAPLERVVDERGEVVIREATEFARLVEYDGRFMYAALCRELPAGVAVHGRGDGGFDPFARGRFLVQWKAPRDWDHVGLLPAVGDDGLWCYPLRGRGWVDAVEWHCAIKEDWRVKVLEHLVWPDRGRPLDKWARELIGARDAVRLRALANGVDIDVADLARDAIRSILLFGLGAFHARPYMLTKTGPIAGAVLPSKARVVTLEADRMVYEEPAPARGGPILNHPEWPACVWARCRVRMLRGPGGTGALALPPAQVVGVHTDALYLTDDPGWADDGEVGRLRLKCEWPGPHKWPASDAELVRLVRGLRRADGREEV